MSGTGHEDAGAGGMCGAIININQLFYTLRKVIIASTMTEECMLLVATFIGGTTWIWLLSTSNSALSASQKLIFGVHLAIRYSPRFLIISFKFKGSEPQIMFKRRGLRLDSVGLMIN